MRDRQSQPATGTARQQGDGPPEKGSHESGRRQRNRQHRSDASINMDELRELIALIRENGLAEFELEREGFRVRLRRDTASAGEEDSAASTISTQPASRAGPPVNTSTAKAHSVPPVAPITAVPSHPGARAQTAASEDQDLHIITSPIVGTFYRAASPNAEAFVKIGAQVETDTVVCIIEAMKLMNEILAEARGEVVKVYVENGQPVEYGQPLFGIKS